MEATFRGYAFNDKWVESFVAGSPEIRVKRIRYPGVKGAMNLNMRTAERELVQSGTIRSNNQSSLLDIQADIISLCDGTRVDTTILALSVHGQVYNTIYADRLDFGAQFKATGLGGANAGDYYGLPYTITYVQINP